MAEHKKCPRNLDCSPPEDCDCMELGWRAEASEGRAVPRSDRFHGTPTRAFVNDLLIGGSWRRRRLGEIHARLGNGVKVEDVVGELLSCIDRLAASRPVSAAPTETQTATPASDYFQRNIRTVELANAVARFLGLNPADEIPFEELTRRLQLGSPRAAQPATTEPNETQRIAQELLHVIGQTLLAKRFTTTLCWNTEQLERLAMFAISAKNELASRPPSPTTPEAQEAKP